MLSREVLQFEGDVDVGGVGDLAGGHGLGGDAVHAAAAEGAGYGEGVGVHGGVVVGAGFGDGHGSAGFAVEFFGEGDGFFLGGADGESASLVAEGAEFGGVVAEALEAVSAVFEGGVDEVGELF